MRIFSYHEYSEGKPIILSVTELDIRKQWYPYWYEMMCKKYGKDVTDNQFDFDSCIEDWIVTNGAWVSK